jgi:hypothetical protein
VRHGHVLEQEQAVTGEREAEVLVDAVGLDPDARQAPVA